MWTQLFWPHNVAASAMNRMADSSWRAFAARGSRTSRKIDNTGCIEGLPNQETPLRINFHPVGNSPSSQMRFPCPKGGGGSFGAACLPTAPPPFPTFDFRGGEAGPL